MYLLVFFDKCFTTAAVLSKPIETNTINNQSNKQQYNIPPTQPNGFQNNQPDNFNDIKSKYYNKFYNKFYTKFNNNINNKDNNNNKQNGDPVNKNKPKNNTNNNTNNNTKNNTNNNKINETNRTNTTNNTNSANNNVQKKNLQKYRARLGPKPQKKVAAKNAMGTALSLLEEIREMVKTKQSQHNIQRKYILLYSILFYFILYSLLLFYFIY